MSEMPKITSLDAGMTPLFSHYVRHASVVCILLGVVLLQNGNAGTPEEAVPDNPANITSKIQRGDPAVVPVLRLWLASISTVMEWTNAKAISEDQAKSITNFLLPNQGMGTGWLASPEATKNGLWARLSKVTWTRVLSMVTVAETSRRLRKSFLA